MAPTSLSVTTPLVTRQPRSALFRLPQEIIGLVIEHGVIHGSDHPIETLRKVVSVCKTWRAAAWANPRIWSRIVFARPLGASKSKIGADSLHVLAQFFARSRACPKTVFLHGVVTPTELAILRNLVNTFAPTIVSLSLGLVDDQNVLLDDAIINHVITLPVLQSLELSTTKLARRNELVLPSMPRLKTLKIPGIFLDSAQPLSRLRNVESLHFRDASGLQLLHLSPAFDMNALPKLRHLHARCLGDTCLLNPPGESVRCHSGLQSLAIRFSGSSVCALAFLRASSLYSLAVTTEIFFYMTWGRESNKNRTCAAFDAFFQAPAPPLRELRLDRVNLSDTAMLKILHLLPKLEVLALSHARLTKCFVQALSGPQLAGDGELIWLCPRLTRLSYLSTAGIKVDPNAKACFPKEPVGTIDRAFFEVLARARLDATQQLNGPANMTTSVNERQPQPLQDLRVEMCRLLRIPEDGSCQWSEALVDFYVPVKALPEAQLHPTDDAWWAFPR